jgi:hypothetical protein
MVQDLASRFYLGGDSSWVENCQAAREFEHTHLALLQGLHHAEKALQVVWCFQNPTLNLYIPVDPAQQDQVRPYGFCPLSAEVGSGAR